MSNGQNTQNISLAIGILAQLLTQAGTLTATIKAAQDSGTDITDVQLDALFTSDDAAKAKLQADIDNAKATQQTLPGIANPTPDVGTQSAPMAHRPV